MSVGTGRPLPRLTHPEGTVEWARRLVEDVFGRLQELGTAINDIGTGGGTGTVTSVSQGTGIVATPNPIIATGSIALANTAVGAGAYGSASQSPTFTVDAQGRLTAAANVTITPAAIGAQPLDADLTEIAALANVAGDLLYTNTTPAWARLGIGGEGLPLVVTGGFPVWDALPLNNPGSVAGALPSTYGGTGFDEGLLASGDILYSTAGAGWNPLTLGTTGQFLRAGATDPTWTTLTAGMVSGGAPLTTANDSNMTLTAGGTPATALLAATSLTLAWAGTLAVARGGIGAGTALAGFNNLSPLTTRGDLLTRDATNNVRKALGASGTFLRSDGTDPQWATITDADVPNTITLDNITQVTTRPATALTMATARLLGRTTAGAGAVEELTVGTGLSLSGGSLGLSLSAIDHNSLLNLAAGVDIHTDYAFLTGRSGGQTLRGGTAASEALTLESTFHGTKGLINLKDKAKLWTANSTVTLSATTDNAALSFDISASMVGNATATLAALNVVGTPTNHTFLTLFSAGGLVGSLLAAPTLIVDHTSGAAMCTTLGLENIPVFRASTGAALTSGTSIGLSHQPQFSKAGTGTMTGVNDTAVIAGPIINASVTLAESIGLSYTPTVNGTLTQSTAVKVAVAGGATRLGMDVANLAGATLNVAVRSAIASGANNYFLQDTGGAKSEFAGLFTKYNNVALVKDGVPYQVATVDLTGQGAAIAATTIYAVPASGAGMYRVAWVATVTRAATTSCVLGGATGFQLQFTDADDSVVKLSNPTTVTSSAVNATGTTISGNWVANCKASTNLQYVMGYTSVGATTMQYNLHVRVERMG